VKTYNDNLIAENYYVGRKASLAAATGEPLDPPCPLATALHGFGLGIDRRILAAEEASAY